MSHVSSGHSVVDVSDPAQAALFPSYAKSARGLSCHLTKGDVLYIPAYWHHAVVTIPDENCVGFSLNLWYSKRGATGKSTMTSQEEALAHWGGSLEDLKP